MRNNYYFNFFIYFMIFMSFRGWTYVTLKQFCISH